MIRRPLFRNSEGAAAVEFALTVPILITLMIGILQGGMILHAYGGLRHALGEGIRYAKVHPGATEAEVLTTTRDSLAGIGTAGIRTLTFQRQPLNGAQNVRLDIEFEIDPIIPFVSLPPIVLSQTKSAYLPS